MSHFSTVAVSFIDTDALLQALAAMGYQPVMHTTPVQLRNDWGTATAEHMASIVVPMPDSKADVGFAQRDGVWHLIADDYELNASNAAAFKQDLALEYAAIQAQQLGYQVVREGSELVACPVQ